MTKRRLYASSLLLLLATAPWWFGTRADAVLLGLPSWAVYSLGVTVAYAACLGVWLGRYWELSAGEEEDGATRASDQGGGEPRDGSGDG